MILWLTFSISGTVLEQYISLVTSKGKAWQRENLTFECVHWLMGSCMHTQLNSPSGRQQWGTAGRWSSLFLTASPGLHDPEHTQQVSYLCVAALPLMQHKIKTDEYINSTLDLCQTQRWTGELCLRLFSNSLSLLPLKLYHNKETQKGLVYFIYSYETVS